MSLPEVLSPFGVIANRVDDQKEWVQVQLPTSGNSVPMTGTADNTNFPGLGFTPVPPGTFGPIPPGSVVPLIDWARLPVEITRPLQEFKVVEPDIPMAPPTNRRRIKLRD